MPTHLHLLNLEKKRKVVHWFILKWNRWQLCRKLSCLSSSGETFMNLVPCILSGCFPNSIDCSHVTRIWSCCSHNSNVGFLRPTPLSTSRWIWIHFKAFEDVFNLLSPHQKIWIISFYQSNYGMRKRRGKIMLSIATFLNKMTTLD